MIGLAEYHCHKPCHLCKEGKMEEYEMEFSVEKADDNMQYGQGMFCETNACKWKEIIL